MCTRTVSSCVGLVGVVSLFITRVPQLCPVTGQHTQYITRGCGVFRFSTAIHDVHGLVVVDGWAGDAARVVPTRSSSAVCVQLAPRSAALLGHPRSRGQCTFAGPWYACADRWCHVEDGQCYWRHCIMGFTSRAFLITRLMAILRAYCAANATVPYACALSKVHSYTACVCTERYIHTGSLRCEIHVRWQARGTCCTSCSTIAVSAPTTRGGSCDAIRPTWCSGRSKTRIVWTCTR